MTPIPQWLNDYLASPTPAGQGYNRPWLIAAAFKVARRVPDFNEAFDLLCKSAHIAGASQQPGRNWQGEIRRALKKAYAIGGTYIGDNQWKQKDGTIVKLKPKWPEVNEAGAKRYANGGPGCYDLWEISPVRWDDDESHAEEVIDQLFKAYELICVGRHKKEFQTAYREDLRGKLHRCSHIVPSPMFVLGGRTQQGKWSDKCNEAVERRRFVVVEFDRWPDKDFQAALIWHLRIYLPLILVCDSAGKSLHGWFYCEGVSEAPGGKLDRFMREAVQLGADRAGAVLSQYMRMPDGRRDGPHENEGARQSVIFFNPTGKLL